MMMMKVCSGFAVLLLLACSGCAVRRVGYVTYAEPAPPAPYIEETPPSPSGGDYAWVNGYWYWNGAQYVWVRGDWVVRPAPGYVWTRSGWVAGDGTYRFVPGRWHTDQRAPAVRYVHPAPAVRVGVSPAYRSVPQPRVRAASPPRQGASVRVRR